MRWMILLGWLAVFSVPARAEVPVLLVLGDSLSAAYGIDVRQGWVALAAQRLAGWKVVNASVSGETTAGGLARLPALLERHDPDVVVIALGANDGLRGLALEQVAQNLDALVASAQDNGARVMLAGMMLPPNYGPRYGTGFAEVFRRIADDRDAALVPFLLDGVALDRKLMQADGLHPRAEAQPRILDNVWAVLGPLAQNVAAP